ncbi:MAG: sugar ABC transporter substrate-binding protein [Candidatus Bipolaricaulota bacterium]
MKKLVALTLAIVLLGVGFSALGSTSGELRIWGDERITALEPLAEDFEEDYGVEVELVEVPFGDIRTKMENAGPSGEGPDILIGAHDWTGELAKNGLIDPLLYMEDQQDDFVDVSVEGFTYSDKIYGLPYAFEAIALIYNTEMVPEAPETWEEVVEISKERRESEEENYGFVYPGTGDPYHTYPFISAYGGYIFAYDGGFDPDDIGLDTEGAIKGLEKLDEMYEEGYLPEGIDYGTAASWFNDGKAAMFMTGPWEIPAIREAGIDFEVAPLPAMDGNQMKPFVGAQGFMLSAFSENKVLANEFLKSYIATDEAMTLIYEENERPPAYIPTLDKVEEEPVVSAFSESARVGVPMPNIPEMGAVWENLGNQLQLISQQKQEPKAAMEDTVEIIKQSIDE